MSTISKLCFHLLNTLLCDFKNCMFISRCNQAISKHLKMKQFTVCLGIALVMLSPIDFISAKPRGRKEVGNLQTLELKFPELPVSKRVELALIEYNKKDKRCSGLTFWFMGTCIALNDEFKYCNKWKEFVVLQKPKDPKSNSFVVRPVCIDLKCRYDSVSIFFTSSFLFILLS